MALCAVDQKSAQVSHSTVEKQRRDRINSLIDEVRFEAVDFLHGCRARSFFKDYSDATRLVMLGNASVPRRMWQAALVRSSLQHF